ncbi:MAG: hypothetical protein ACPHJ3_21285, partial [Rubripirellula sp.]
MKAGHHYQYSQTKNIAATSKPKIKFRRSQAATPWDHELVKLLRLRGLSKDSGTIGKHLSQPIS